MNNKIKLPLAPDAHRFLSFSTTRWHAFLIVVANVAAAIHLLILRVPSALEWTQDHWPDLLPLLQHLFPSVSQAGWVTVVLVISTLLRVTDFGKPTVVPPP